MVLRAWEVGRVWWAAGVVKWFALAAWGGGDRWHVHLHQLQPRRTYHPGLDLLYTISGRCTIMRYDYDYQYQYLDICMSPRCVLQ